MAAESLIGGQRGEEINQKTKEMLDEFLSDTKDGTARSKDLGHGAQLVVGIGSKGETQGAIVTGGEAIRAQLNDGVLNVAVGLPAGINIAFEGLSRASTPTEVGTFINTQIDNALPVTNTDPGAAVLRKSLQKAVSNLTDALAAQGVTSSIVRVISFTDDSSLFPGGTGGIISFDASGSARNELFALNLSDINPNNTLHLRSLESGMLVGNGSVVVDGDTGANLQGDNRNQKITGSSGNDTLVGGGGNDTLIGGSGDDTLGFNALGNYTIQLGDGNDKLAFQFDGINSIADLAPFITGVSESNGNVTYEFVDGAATITLVGMTANDITADMVKFTLE